MAGKLVTISLQPIFCHRDIRRTSHPAREQESTPLLTTRAPSPARRLMDGVLIVLVVSAAFLLGCQELFDSDVWWHVRAGQWIWENGRVPALDPFTFASADRRGSTCTGYSS